MSYSSEVKEVLNALINQIEWSVQVPGAVPIDREKQSEAKADALSRITEIGRKYLPERRTIHLETDGKFTNANEVNGYNAAAQQRIAATPQPKGVLANPQVRQQFNQSSKQAGFNPVAALPKVLGNNISRGIDQANVFDNNRTFKQRTPTQTKSNFEQVGQVGGQTVRATVPATLRGINTIDAQRRQLNAYGNQLAAQITKNPTAYRNATKQFDKATNRFGNTGGIMNVGTFYNSDEAKRGDFKTGIKRIGGGTAESGLEVASLYAGGVSGEQLASQGIKKGLIEAAPTIGKNVLLNAAQGGVSAYNQGASGKDIIKNAAVSAGLGTAGDLAMGVGGAIVPKLGQATTNLVKQQASTGILNPKVVANKLTPKYNGLTKEKIIMDPAKLDILNEAKDVLATMYKKGESPTTLQAQRIINGLHKINDENGLNFINGNNAERVQKITQYLEQNGEAIPKYQRVLDRQVNAEAARVIKKAEDDFIAEKISPAQLEKIRNDTARAISVEAKSTNLSGKQAQQSKELPSQSELRPDQTVVKNQSLPDNTTKLPKSKQTEVKLNTDRLNPDAGYSALQHLDDATKETITRLSNKEVESLAKDAGLDTKTYTVEQTRQKIAAADDAYDAGDVVPVSAIDEIIQELS